MICVETNVEGKKSQINWVKNLKKAGRELT